MRRAVFTMALLLLCMSLAASFTASPDDKKGRAKTSRKAAAPKKDTKRVYLIHADELSYDKPYTYIEAPQILNGHVEFEHAGARLKCDSACFFEASNSFEAFGNVKMTQGDTLSLTSDYGFYDGNNQLLEAKDNVVLKHRKTTLYTDSLYFDRIYSMGYFEEGGQLVDGNTTLISDWGEYHTDTKTAIFYYDVRMHDKNFLLTTDSLYYDTNLKMAHIVGPSDITSGKSHIYSELGYYDTQREQSRLMRRSRIDNGQRTITADSIFHDEPKAISEAYGDVVYEDKTNRNKMLSDYGYYDDSTGYALITDSALVIDYSQPDTLYMHADTFKVFTFNHKTDSVNRILHAYNHVKAYRRDVQAVCDSLVYIEKDSCMTLYRDPILWNLNQQLLGEVIHIYMNDSTVNRAHVVNQAFSIEKLKEDKAFNQVSSKEMFAFFDKGEIREAKAVTNVVVAYYPEDHADSSYVGLITMNTSQLRMFLKDRQLERIWTPKSDGVMYPMTQIPPQKRFLEGFAWFDDIRPTSPQDVFVWRGKRQDQVLKPQERREPPKVKL